MACGTSSLQKRSCFSDGHMSAQLERLQAENEQEAAKRAEQEEELRKDVAEALESFGMGELNAEGLLSELHDLGIEVDCSAEQLTLLTRCEAQIFPYLSSSTPSDRRVRKVAVKPACDGHRSEVLC